MKTNLLSIILVLCFSILISFPLSKPGLYQMHDDQQIARLYLFDKALKDGQFPVRWVDELGFGFGYPLFNYYPPFIYYLGEIFHLIGFGFIDSIKIIIFLSIFLSGISIYLLIKELFGRLPGFVASIFYMYVPYRAIDVYIRGALSESFSFVWLPLILWSFYKMYKTQKQIFVIISGLFLALLMITHNLTFLAFFLFLPIFWFFLFLRSDNKKNFLTASIFSIALSLGLSAFFWLPSILEKVYTLVDKIYLTTDYRVHFVYLRQLWNSPWGFAGSAQGLVDGISFKIGKLHILVSAAAIILATIHYPSAKKNKDSFLPNFKISALFFFLFLFSAFMTTTYSEDIWSLLAPLKYLQFPWRFLIFTALFSSLLAASFVHLLKISILKLIAGIILIGLLIYTNTKLFKPQTYRPFLTDEVATSKERLNWETSLLSFDYASGGVKIVENEFGTKQIGIERAKIPKEKIIIENGEVSYNLLEQKSHKLKFQLKVERLSMVRLNIFNFPGWRVNVDGETVAIDDNNPLRLITFDIPLGVHQVAVEFSNTPVRNFANVISLISFAFLVYYFARSWLTRKKS